MNHDEAYMMGDVAGFDDGYSGNLYNSTPPASVGLDLQGVYRAAYLEAYAAGQAAFARTMEP